MSGAEVDYVSTRGEAIPPEPPRTRRARPTAADNPGPAADPQDDAQGAEPRRPAPDEALAAMSAQARAEKERADRLEAERVEWQRERDALTRGKTDAETRGINAQKLALETEITAQERRIAAARQRYRAAREAGDIEAEEAANDELADARARKVLLDRDKAAWADWEAQQAAEAEEAKRRRTADPEPRREPVGERRDAQPPASTNGLSASDIAWVNNGHEDFESDPECNQWIYAAANRVIADGIVKGSPAFYRELDKAYDRFQRIRELDQQADGYQPQRRQQQEPEEEPLPRRRAAQPSAASMSTPPSRGNGDGGRARGVSPEAVARRMGITIEEMREFARGRRGGLEGYARELAKDLGMT